MVVGSTNRRMNNIKSKCKPHASRREKVFDLLDRCWGKKRSQYELQNYVKKQTGLRSQTYRQVEKSPKTHQGQLFKSVS